MAKRKITEDPEREERIDMEIVVDAYGPDERAMGWYCYLEDYLQVPFTATCMVKRATSPLKVKDVVEVLKMAKSEECSHDMFVMVRWEKGKLAVPLSQLTPMDTASEKTKQAIEDWHYWVNMGYEF